MSFRQSMALAIAPTEQGRVTFLTSIVSGQTNVSLGTR